MKARDSERGAGILWLFVAVALFGLLAYAFLNNSRNSISWLTDEQAKAVASTGQDCSNVVNMAVKRLELRGCGAAISHDPNGANLILGAPLDGSCSVYHPNGGGAKPCTSTPQCDLTALAIGEGCDGIIHVGVSSGRRVYTTAAPVGSFTWASNTPSVYRDTGARSWVDGLENTNILVSLTGHGTPHPAAQACRALGPEWYLPSREETSLLYYRRNVGQLAGTVSTSGFYWTSTEFVDGDSFAIRLTDGFWPTEWKGNSFLVRCMRRD